MNMKKILISLFLFTLLISCTTSNVMSFSTQEGPRLFIKPVILDGNYKVKTDMNIPCDDFKISGDVVVNYSVFFPAGNEPNIKSAALVFDVNGETINVLNPVMMFIESAGGKTQEARFTSVLPAESMKKMCENAEFVSASLYIKDKVIPLNVSKLSKALRELSLNLL